MYLQFPTVERGPSGCRGEAHGDTRTPALRLVCHSRGCDYTARGQGADIVGLPARRHDEPEGGEHTDHDLGSPAPTGTGTTGEEQPRRPTPPRWDELYRIVVAGQ